jgi:hypothetical protein
MIFDWFKKSEAASQKSIENLKSQIAWYAMLLEQERDKKLTVDDLRFKPEQVTRFKLYTKEQRQDLHDACEHIILTRYKEEDRKAAIRLRDYLMLLTVSKNNQIGYDKTVTQGAFEETSQYFKK